MVQRFSGCRPPNATLLYRCGYANSYGNPRKRSLAQTIAGSVIGFAWRRSSTRSSQRVPAPFVCSTPSPPPHPQFRPGRGCGGKLASWADKHIESAFADNRPVAFVIITDVDLRLESVLSHVRGHPHPISPPRPCVPPASRSWAKVASSGGAGVARGAGYRCRC